MFGYARIHCAEESELGLLVRLRHGSDNREVPSIQVRLCLFPVTMFCFDKIATKL